jgi:antirestriction protein ArdC
VPIVAQTVTEEDTMTVSAYSFADVLRSAVEEPGIISAAYSQFHSYSLGNQLLAWSQCVQRGIQPGPIATYQRWKELGRQVRRGEKAITLCRPVTAKRIETTADGTEETTAATWFVFKPFWFVLAQTDGQPLQEQPTPTWDAARALAALDVIEIPFDLLNGNCLGFARERSIAINPVNPSPHKTRFHELAHVLLGHTSEGLQADSERTPRNLRECEAEAVALLCCAALGLPGVECCRGYIQTWWGTGNPIPERSAQRILKTVDGILRAGHAAVSDESIG